MDISKNCLNEFIIKMNRIDLVDDVDKMKEINVILNSDLKNALVKTYNEHLQAIGKRKIGGSFWKNVAVVFEKKVGEVLPEGYLISQLAKLKAEKWPGTEQFGKNLFLNFQCFLLSRVYFFFIRQ